MHISQNSSKIKARFFGCTIYCIAGNILRAFYFGEFGELTKFAKYKTRQLQLYAIYTVYRYSIQYIRPNLQIANSPKFEPLQIKALYSSLTCCGVINSGVAGAQAAKRNNYL